MTKFEQGDKRRQILEAAVKVFSQKGFHNAKVDEIAQLADVGKGTVYEYFSSKTQLFQEMFLTGLRFYIDNLKKQLKPEWSGREKLSNIARLHFEFIMKYKDLAKITMTEHTYFDDEFRDKICKLREQKLALITRIIEEGISSGEFRNLDPHAGAVVFMGALGGVFSQFILSSDNADYKALTESMLDIFFKGLMR